MKSYDKLLTAAVIRGAAKLIREFGWVQGRMGNHDLGFCIMGAVDEVVQNGDLVSDPDNYSAMATVMSEVGSYLCGMATERICGPVVWQDQAGRTKEEVLILLDATATRLEAPATPEINQAVE